MDSVEKEYEQQIHEALYRGDNDDALELTIGLRQYREMYK